jgi:hypothetical protein
VFLLLLLASGAYFALFALTGKPHYRHRGWMILKWTLIAAFAFFAVLAVQRFTE